MNENNIRLKEQICDNLNGKRYIVTWLDDIQCSGVIIAQDEEEAREKFFNGEVIDGSDDGRSLDTDSIQIYEDK